VDEIHLDGRSWQSVDDFYVAYLRAVGAPEWHGHNLDALWDSLTGGDVNERKLPLRIHITGLDEMGLDARQMTERFANLVKQARDEGHQIELS
jgi:RNAse (barnase) inhibitor barstar